jgi:5'-phosphate synthase pdxT subunit
MITGILALQGDYLAHGRVLEKLDRDYIYVRKPEELCRVDSLIIPGGETTTMRKLAKTIGLWDPLKTFDNPILGTCAGIILLASKIENPSEEGLNRLDITISRNAYGSQINSFTADGRLLIGNKPIEMVFIRAPRIMEIGNDVEIIATLHGEPVGIRQGNIIGLTFHPELADDISVYEEFFALKKTAKVRVA